MPCLALQPVPDRGREERLETYAFPRIGGMPVSDVTSADVLEILTPIWHVRATTARRETRATGPGS